MLLLLPFPVGARLRLPPRDDELGEDIVVELRDGTLECAEVVGDEPWEDASENEFARR